MRIQYAALNDLESVVKDLSKLGRGGIALIYDPKTGWVATDEIDILASNEGPGVFELKVRGYADWARPHVANAVSALGAVRFLGESAMEKLFRKALPLPPLAQEASNASPKAGNDEKGSNGGGAKTALKKK